MKKKRKLKSIISFALVGLMTIGFVPDIVVSAKEDSKEYKIYPNPQLIEYSGGSFEISKDVNVVYEGGIDVYTKRLVEDILEIKGRSSSVSNAVVDGKTNILVGIYESEEYVDNYSKNKDITGDTALFNKKDSHVVNIKDDVISVLGSDTDSAFYGLTSLKHIFKQITGDSVLELNIRDYSDVPFRGFIEGYYGNPWSNEDRAELMRYGGEFKMNQYIFAPKDDPYHNSKWRELYPEEKLAEIAELAKVGEESKNRYVYSLHPYMSNPVRHGSEGTYQEDLEIIKKKFIQLMDAGVRQFGILADDAAVPAGGADSYVRLMKDLTDWLETMQSQYSGLKKEMIFCPNDYMGNGGSEQLKIVNKMPQSVSIVMTGGRIWGEVSNSFVNGFYNNIASEGNPGRGPYMWINWPCTDNSKQHLIMGGNDTFLHPGVDPEKIQGIVLNPMQQSEASKSAIFANADYAWNVWETKEEADENWNDSFNYMDHLNINDTEGSVALRELSKHMINQNMDGRVTKLEESVELAPKLNAFKETLELGESIKGQAEELILEFNKLLNAANTYEAKAGNKRTLGQIQYWIDSWKNTATANIALLEGLIEFEEENYDNVWDKYSLAQSEFEQSKTHSFWYVDHYENAEVGVQHIVPFTKTLLSDLGNKVTGILDPTKVITTAISNRKADSGKLSDLLDKDLKTEVAFKNPNTIAIGDYVGIKYNKEVKINNVTFNMGLNANLADTFKKAKLQYTVDGKEWLDVEGTNFVGNESEITVDNLDLTARGIRLIATEEKKGTWFGCREILVNEKIEEPEGPSFESIGIYNTEAMSIKGGSIANLTDGNEGTFAHFAKGPYLSGDPDRDTTPVGAWVGLEFDKAITLGEVKFVQATGDKILKGELEYKTEGGEWLSVPGATYAGEGTYTHTFNDEVIAKGIRLRNTEKTNKWWQVKEITATERGTAVLGKDIIKTDIWSVYRGPESNLTDGSDNTFVWYDPDGSTQANLDASIPGDFIGLDLGRVAHIGEVRVVVGAGDGDKWKKYHLEYSEDNVTWKTFKSYSGLNSGKDIIEEDFKGKEARYIRLVNDEKVGAWVKFSEFSVSESSTPGCVDYTYTNVDSYKTIINDFGKDFASLLVDGRYTLKENEYIGVVFDRIRDLREIRLEGTTLDGLKLQVSNNEIEWIDVADKKDLSNGRYIRLINDSNSNKTFELSRFEVYTNEISGPSFISSNIALGDTSNDSRTNGSLGNLFDGDLKTSSWFTGLPREGQTIEYDLGQERRINSLRLYVLDSERDYLRDAVIEVSNDKKDWKTALTIGDGVENTAEVDNPINEGYTHDTSNPGNAYVESKDLDLTGRYMRIRITAPYNRRWVKVNEILINGGEYVKENNDPTFESTVIEERGHGAEKLLDGDILTSFKPSAANGSLIYRLSDNTNVKLINIIQNGNSISNAKVLGRVPRKNRSGETEWVELGILDKSLKTIYNPFNENLFEIKIEWGDVVPTIYEMIPLTDENLLPNRAELQEVVDNLKELNAESYTVSTFTVYEEAIGKMVSILTKENNATQNDIDQSIISYNAARNLLAKRGDVSILDKLLKSDDYTKLNEKDYTPESWTNFKAVVSEAEEMIADNSNVTEADVKEMEINLATAKAGLIESDLVVSFKNLQALIDEYANLNPEDYTEESFAEFNNVLDKAKTMAKEEKASLDEVRAMIKELKISRASLVASDIVKDKTPLESAIAGFDENKYTTSSWKDFADTLEEAKAALKNEKLTNKEMNELIKKLNEKAKVLVVKGDISILEALVAEFEKLNPKDYTVESWKGYEEAIREAKKLIGNRDDLTQEEINEVLVKVELAKSNLELFKEADQNTGDNNTSNSDSITKTGDKANIGIYLGLAVLALTGTAVVMRKKSEVLK
ncbi:beta-N-acetylglucosaminidase domain-containing protein [Clostridium paraputrificum]|uniref:beta-N-acetylglucosaminidase domain-containing protein n=1 Tax=Clostridium paraputrificum TaxID=29363 RepID=UPI003D357DDC